MKNEIRLEMLLDDKNPNLELFLYKCSKLIEKKERFILIFDKNDRLHIDLTRPKKEEKNEEETFIYLSKSKIRYYACYITLINIALSFYLDVIIEYLANNTIVFTISTQEDINSFNVIKNLYTSFKAKA